MIQAPNYLARTPCQSRVELANAYGWELANDFEEMIFDQSFEAIPPRFTEVNARREIRLSCLMGGPL